MAELLADRFVAAGAAWMDLSSGASVRVRLAPARGMGAQLAWSDRCEGFARVRHPALTVLLDYGTADARRTFEAYSAAPPLRLSGAHGSRLLTHAARFLDARGLPLTRDVAPFAIRPMHDRDGPGDRRRAAAPGLRGRPLGITLQPPPLLEALRDALVDTAPGGVMTVEVAGDPGSGVRTLRTLIARLARLEGYVPICGGLLQRCPWLAALVAGRHVCMLLDEGEPIGARLAAARLVSELAVSSARRHVCIRFRRSTEPGSGAMWLAPMGVKAMTAMVFVDRDSGPTERELFEAARASGGNPGRFLRSLRAASFEDHVSRAMVVHESPASYVIEPRSAAPKTMERRVAGRLDGACARAERLAQRGRHAAATRLLTRAARVLEGREEPDGAARCAGLLGWILRDRGRSAAAQAQFERARALATAEGLSVCALVGLGVIWTDERRFADAEAALRGALAIGSLVEDPLVSGRASRALARCLYWQQRADEGLLLLERVTVPSGHPDEQASLLALRARLQLTAGDLPGALRAAAEARRLAVAGRAAAAAARAMVLAHAALGDRASALEHAQQGLVVAAAAHLPLAGLRIRAALLAAIGSAPPVSPPQGSDVGTRHRPRPNGGAGDLAGDAARLAAQLRFAIAHRALPPLLRDQLEAACAAAAAPPPAPPAHAEASMRELRQLLEVAHAAPDDHAAADEICRVVCETLRAATVQLIAATDDRRLLARAGRPWTGDPQLVERALAGATGTATGPAGEPRQWADVVRYGAEPIAVLACRWVPGAPVSDDRAGAILQAGALAIAPSARALLDRTQVGAPEPAWGDLIGASPAAATLREAIARAARAPFPVLIEGESGSGKELVARAIHRLGSRRDRRLCTVNCAAFSDDLLEAELFGHARGAFTGAVGERAGLFEEADGGTLFLDEVGELSPRAQAKLLRVLQDGEVRRVGENAPRRVDARIVAATNRRLEEDAETGRFRSDLRFRLDVIRITVPPLRDRPADIPALAAHFWEEATRRVGSRATLAPETLGALARYDWPGNVRQLQNALASLAVHAPRRGRITPAMLPGQIARAAISPDATFEAAREEFERRFVLAALARASGQRSRAARALGVSRQGLAKIIRRLGIEVG